jgi:predicted O-methyltransferase YrrM
MPRPKIGHEKRTRRMLKYAGRVVALFLLHPVESCDRLTNRLANRRQRSSTPRRPLPINDDWHAALHSVLGKGAGFDEGFEISWRELEESLSTSGVITGTGHDADPALAEAIWCLLKELLPETVVETGVARGVTSGLVLKGLAEKERGHLWSIDLPPVKDPWRQQFGAAVPSELRDRWTFRRGSSQRLLARVCAEVVDVDLFVHDSLHTSEHVKFELETVWPHLRVGGAMVVDDVDSNDGLARFLDGRSAAWLVGAHRRKQGRFGIVVKESQL